ncbi:MAG: DNA/RNA non-specific endonuclease [Acidobacteria bacterium]|nr:DNA/RNA non-specific endonuclease [Acidobacteriota bacterium]
MDEQVRRLQAILSRIQGADPTLGEELQSKRSDLAKAGPAAPGFGPMAGPTAMPAAMPMAGMAVEGVAAARAPMPQVVPETIVLRTGRPVLRVFQDAAKLEFDDAESEIWRSRLKKAKKQLTQAIRATGRIELAHHPRFQWVGTGWLVDPEVVVTNRHVANEFGRRRGDRFVFRSSFGDTMTADIDFLEEHRRAESRAVRLVEILHIEEEGGPDLAFLRVEPSDELAQPIRLSARAVQADDQVAVIGYPARDSRIPDQDLMFSIFGDVFDKKRLAPGQVTGLSHGLLQHDCSTLGGNSGSVVLHLDSGEALGLHFAGRFLEANYAVPAALVADRFSRLGRSEGRPAPAPPQPEDNASAPPASSTPAPSPATPPSTHTVSFSIPVKLQIEVGSPDFGSQAVTLQTSVSPALPGPRRANPADDLIETEARPEDYADRAGYDPAFLAEGPAIPLPKIERDAGEVVEFEFAGKKEMELRYTHFSVVMHRKRRLCFYSAVNIDGKNSKKTVRPGWRTDPRIPANLQIIKECYGNEPKFSRGHMTRREDPAWGSKALANLGCADSMHVTNAVPQMQSFNAGIWLGLEDYALQNAREDDMRITVLTGPFLHANDPIRFGVKIPRSFWKVIAFVHDQTGKLCASGYTISQDNVIPEQEFVFGEYDTHQRSLRHIEQKAGISFGGLTSRDVMGDEDEEALSAPLSSFSEIRLLSKGA